MNLNWSYIMTTHYLRGVLNSCCYIFTSKNWLPFLSDNSVHTVRQQFAYGIFMSFAIY